MVAGWYKIDGSTIATGANLPLPTIGNTLTFTTDFMTTDSPSEPFNGTITLSPPDNIAPTVLNPNITVVGTLNSIILTWDAATDNVTPQNQLKYSVSYKKASEDTWTTVNLTGAVSYTINGLDAETDYEINLVVRDVAGNQTDYTAASFTTEEAPTVSVTGVWLNKTTMVIDVGNTETLTATVAPDDASDKIVTWNSDNNSVATVDEAGLVTAVSSGTATITVTTTDGDFTATCVVTVAELTSAPEIPAPAYNLTVYPTVIAVGQTVTVEFDASSDALKGAVIILYNLTGVKVSEHSVQGSVSRIAAPQASGIYILRMTSHNGTLLGTTRIVVE